MVDILKEIQQRKKVVTTTQISEKKYEYLMNVNIRENFLKKGETPLFYNSFLKDYQLCIFAYQLTSTAVCYKDYQIIFYQ